MLTLMLPPQSNELAVGQGIGSWLETRNDYLCSTLEINFSCQATPTAKRNVRISEKVTVHEIPNLDDIEQYIKDLYLSKDEIGRIHAEAWQTVDDMNMGIDYSDQADFSKRGLVDLKDESIQRRKKMREGAYKVVFGVQSFAMGKTAIECMDPVDVLADLYGKAASDAKKEAYMTGISDAIAAGRALDL